MLRGTIHRAHTNMDTHGHTWTHIETHGHTHTWAAPSKDILEPDLETAQPFKRSPNEYDCATLWNSSFLSVSVKRERERRGETRVLQEHTRLAGTHASPRATVHSIRECVANHNPQECSCFESCIARFVTSLQCVGLEEYRYIVRLGAVVVEIEQQTL